MKISQKILKFICIIFLIIFLFPKSISLKELDPANFIINAQNWDFGNDYGGFSDSLKEKNASIDCSSMAIICLDNLGIENETIFNVALDYIIGCEQYTGGYSHESTVSYADLKSTYWAISCLNNTQNLDWVDNKTFYWIKERQLINASEPWNYGGFEAKNNTNFVTIENTFYAIGALYQSAKLNLINTTTSLQWVKSRQMNDGGFELFDGLGYSDLASTYYATHILSIIDGFDSINKSSLISYLIQKQNLNSSDMYKYGGFGNSPNITCDILATYFALHSLHILNSVDKINIDAVLSYLEDLQLENGAFTVSKDVIQPSITFTYFGYSSICLIEEYYLPDGENDSFFLFYFIIIMIVIFICIALLLSYNYIKKKIKRSRSKLKYPNNQKNHKK